MGANQSSYAGSSSESGTKVASEVKTCYYELLGVDSEASEDE